MEEETQKVNPETEVNKPFDSVLPPSTLVDEMQITVRKVQTGILTIFTNAFGKDIIHHYETLEQALLGYADELFHPEKYAQKIETAEVGEAPKGTGKAPQIDEGAGGPHLE